MAHTDAENRFPLGPHDAPDAYNDALKAKWLGALEMLPAWMDAVIENLDEAQLKTPIREGGWSIHQIIHHLADSHMVAFERCKLALTEKNPIVKPYDQDKWNLLADVADTPVNIANTLLHALHRKWVALLKGLSDADWDRTFFHPERNLEIALWQHIDHYAWHSRHHMEQMRTFRLRQGWA